MDKTLGIYKIQREFGKGGMGIIYKGLDPKNNRAVAIKVLPPTMVDKTTVERFNREAMTMKKLKHPNVIEVMDFGMEKGQHYLVMEFVDGDNLKNMIKGRGKFSVSDCVGIISQAAEALAYTHKEGVIHRDIKPANIMVTSSGRVKVMDFGLAKVMGVTNLTVSGSSVGTAEYMSPEQAGGEAVDSRTDIYSLGATMFEMLSGCPPYQGESFQEILRMQKEEPVPAVRDFNKEVPSELEQVIAKAMAKDLADRYQKTEEFIEELQKYRVAMPRVEPPTEEVAPKPKPAPGPKPEPTLKPEVYVGDASSYFMRNIIIFVLVVGAAGFYFRHDLETVYYKVTDKIGIGSLESKTERYVKRVEKAEEYFRSGMKYEQSGDLDLAIKEYKRAIDLRKNYPSYYKNLALTYEKKNEKKKAISVWQDLLKYDSSSTLGRMAKQHIDQLSR